MRLYDPFAKRSITDAVVSESGVMTARYELRDNSVLRPGGIRATVLKKKTESSVAKAILLMLR